MWRRASGRHCWPWSDPRSRKRSSSGGHGAEPEQPGFGDPFQQAQRAGGFPDHVDQPHAVADVADPRAAGFITVVGGLISRPEIAAALRAEEETTRTRLHDVVVAAQQQGQARDDLTPDRLTSWVMLLVDGFTSQVAGGGFDALSLIHI